jgi:hypothetical protein
MLCFVPESGDVFLDLQVADLAGQRATIFKAGPDCEYRLGSFQIRRLLDAKHVGLVRFRRQKIRIDLVNVFNDIV